jgi:hypothetical protein
VNYVLVDNATARPTLGTFAGLAQGSIVTVGTTDLRLTYAFAADGDGVFNDVALVPVPEPTAAVVAGMAGMAGLLAARRRRRA